MVYIFIRGRGCNHTLTVYSKDNAGNSSVATTVNFTVTLPPDNTNPTVIISSPSSGASIEASAVSIAGTSTDPGTDPSGVKEVWYKLDNTSWQQASGTTSWSATISGVSNGSRTLSVYAVDNKTNYSVTNTVSFTLYLYQYNLFPILLGVFFSHSQQIRIIAITVVLLDFLGTRSEQRFRRSFLLDIAWLHIPDYGLL